MATDHEMVALVDFQRKDLGIFEPFFVAPRQNRMRRGPSFGGSIIEPTVIQSPEKDGRDAALAAKGDSQAFERLYRCHLGRVHSLAYRMVGAEWAEDLTQEVFIRAWTKLGTFRGSASFGTWLHRLAVNLILSRRETLNRRRKRQLPDGEILDRMPAKSGPPGALLDFEEAIQRLPKGAKQVFVLFDVEGYPHGEIAELLGISEGTSKSQLHRARMIMREHLKG